MKAQDIMTANPATVTPDTRVRQAAKLMKDHDVGILPVVEREGSTKLVGLLTDRDIAIRLVAEGMNPDESEVRALMSANPKTARASDSVKDVMKLMGEQQLRRIPIVDDRGGLVGIVAQADIVIEASDDDMAKETVEQISRPGGRNTT